MNLDFLDSGKYHFVKQIKQSIYENQSIIIDKKTGKYEMVYFWFYDNTNYQNFCLMSQVNARLQYLKTNIPIIKAFNHPTILKLKDYRIIDSNDLNAGCFLITKYPINGCLSTLTNEYLQTNGEHNKKMNPTIRSKIIFGIASAMQYLHTKNAIKNNLSLDNIYLDENFEPKFLNDCLTKSLNQKYERDPLYYKSYKSRFHGIRFEENYDYAREKADDVYSFGLFLYSLFSKKFSFTDKKPDLMPDCYWQLISKCWVQTSDKSLKFDEIVEILKNDEFAIEEFGMKTDIEKLHEYQERLQKISQLAVEAISQDQNQNQNLPHNIDDDDDDDIGIPIDDGSDDDDDSIVL